MSREAPDSWIVLSPPFPDRSLARAVFRGHAERLAEILKDGETDGALDEALQASLRSDVEDERATASRAALRVLTDLARQRWSMRLSEAGDVEVHRPDGVGFDPLREKQRIRAQELLKRDEQLRQPAARRFVQGMEKRFIHRGHFASIFSVIRDGRELADSLRRARSLEGDAQVRALRETVHPYLQFVDDAERCAHTGLRVQDMWRYFRHTWTNQYTSTPGRSMAFLVRDRAREHHPVIGIGSLGSPIVQIRERDAWIGWDPASFVERVAESPAVEIGLWLQETVTKAVKEIYVDDFFEEELLSPSDIRSPTDRVLARLIEYGDSQRKLHHRLARSQDLKQSAVPDQEGSTEAHWRLRAQTHLYRSKRAVSLADMLRCRMLLQQQLSSPPTRDEVGGLLDSAAGRRTVKKVLRKAKADRVGIAMADITVCGAVAPYGPILGGKLVSMLAASPQVVSAYRDKYVRQESEIASSMAGRPIIRSSHLAFLGTTSLYGVGSSQYNRLRMPAGRIGGEPDKQLAFLELGKSDAYGTSHFSATTVCDLVSLVQQSSNGQKVNSIFGEGVSPKMRKIRDGLDALNLPANSLLQHGRQRIVYGVPLVRNLREFLLGIDGEPEYRFSLADPEGSSEAIGRWWTERWLRKRIASDEVLARVAEHTLVRPVRHGARVPLPPIDDGQDSLFDDLAF